MRKRRSDLLLGLIGKDGRQAQSLRDVVLYFVGKGLDPEGFDPESTVGGHFLQLSEGVVDGLVGNGRVLDHRKLYIFYH